MKNRRDPFGAERKFFGAETDLCPLAGQTEFNFQVQKYGVEICFSTKTSLLSTKKVPPVFHVFLSLNTKTHLMVTLMEQVLLAQKTE